jgi:hypothetical protein
MSASIQTLRHKFLEHSNAQEYRCENLSSSYVDCVRSVSVSDRLLVRHCSFAVKISQI